MEAAKISILDEKTGQIQELSVGVLDEKLRELLEALKKFPERMTQLGKYTLKSFDVRLALTASAILVSAEGSIVLHYEQ